METIEIKAILDRYMYTDMGKHLLILLIFLIIGCHGTVKETEYLIRICAEEPCEPGAKAGYANQHGEIIVPIGTYDFCYTDTIKLFGIVLDHRGTCKAIDKRGKELFQVYWYDNGPDAISGGLFRIVVNGKIGYANDFGEIVIPPQFKCTTPFENGWAKVALDCNLVSEGEHTRMESEAWFYIDRNGNKRQEQGPN